MCGNDTLWFRVKAGWSGNRTYRAPYTSKVVMGLETDLWETQENKANPWVGVSIHIGNMRGNDTPLVHGKTGWRDGNYKPKLTSRCVGMSIHVQNMCGMSAREHGSRDAIRKPMKTRLRSLAVATRLHIGNYDPNDRVITDSTPDRYL